MRVTELAAALVYCLFGQRSRQGMNEALRQFALGVAGVRMWYAREPLPGAAPSPAFDFIEDDAGGASEPVAPLAPLVAIRQQAPSVTGQASRQSLARLQGLLGGEPARKSGLDRTASPHDPKIADPAPSPVPDEPELVADRLEAPSQVPGLRTGSDGLAGQHVALNLRFWQGQHWLLISASPDEAAAALEDRLANNILKALGDAAVRSEALRWPVFRNPSVPGNDAAGAAAVLEAMGQEMKAPSQLRLGVEPDVTGPQERALWQALLGPLGQPTVSFPRSLAALSSEPDSKRQLWQALKGLPG